MGIVKICKRHGKLTIKKCYKKNRSKENKIVLICKICADEYTKKYRIKNERKIKKYNKNYYILTRDHQYETHREWVNNNKDKLKKYQKKYRKQHKEELQEYAKKYVKKNKSKINKYLENYFSENSEKLKQKRREYYKKNREKILKYQKKYSKLKKT